MSRKKKREQRAIEDRREAMKKICRVWGEDVWLSVSGSFDYVPTPQHEKDAERRGEGKTHESNNKPSGQVDPDGIRKVAGLGVGFYDLELGDCSVLSESTRAYRISKTTREEVEGGKKKKKRQKKKKTKTKTKPPTPTHYTKTQKRSKSPHNY